MIEPNPLLNACGYAHDIVVISAQPVPNAAVQIPHTVALYRCRKCRMHISILHVGQWQFADFHLAEMEQLERDAKC